LINCFQNFSIYDPLVIYYCTDTTNIISSNTNNMLTFIQYNPLKYVSYNNNVFSFSSSPSSLVPLITNNNDIKIKFTFNKINFLFNSSSTGGNIYINDTCSSFNISFVYNNKTQYYITSSIPDTIVTVNT
jgi:hypothetical protein